jgi:hypothetical protein
LIGCGESRRSSVRLTVTIQVGNEAAHRFSLDCEPTGGDMPHRVTLCRMIQAHPQVMLHSGAVGCDGSPTYNHVTVRGTDHGRSAAFDGDPVCGPIGLAYEAAVSYPHALPVAAVRLHCLEPRFVGSTGACLNAVPRKWKPIGRHG